jgi:hypothetical protein
MKPVPESEPRLTSEGLGMLIAGREYGQRKQGKDYFESLKSMTIPSSLNRLSDAIESASKLLALLPNAELDNIYDAYGEDLKLITRYRLAFEVTIDAAVKGRAASDQEAAQRFLDLVREGIKGIVHESSLHLSHDNLGLPAGELLKQLQRQFKDDVQSLKESIAMWLHILSENEVVSVIEWFGEKALRYHFFRVESSKLADKSVKTVGDHFVGRTVTTTTKTTTEVIAEKRTHTVVKARKYSLTEYRNKVPERIATLISALPPEVRPFATIIDGTLSHEEVTRKLISHDVKTETKSVFIEDPALALFDTYAIDGWGGSTPEAATSTYKGHPEAAADRWLTWSLIATGLCAAAVTVELGVRGALLVALIGGFLTTASQIFMRFGKK